MSFESFVSALRAELPSATAKAKRHHLSPAEVWNVLVVAQLRSVLLGLAAARGHDPRRLEGGRLFREVPGFEADDRVEARARLAAELKVEGRPDASLLLDEPALAFSQLYESLLAARPTEQGRDLRKRTGSYYTPAALTRVVVERALSAVGAARLQAPLAVLDPAIGGAAFLVEVGTRIAERSGRPLVSVVRDELHGVDVSPLALAVAEASLWVLADAPELTLAEAGANLRQGDALCDHRHAPRLGRVGVDFAELLGGRPGFDLVLGNPPWVAFAGRATQPLPPGLREYYRAHYQAFRGYPTLHALFVELAARLAPGGVIALLVPSPLADLDGYRPVRSALSRTHRVCEPLLELGQDAFESVTQPCFALVASPRSEPEAHPQRAFVLTERKRAGAAASEIRTPPALSRLANHPRLPPDLFGEMGLQTNGVVTRQLLYRGDAPPPEFSYALLEGRNVSEFTLGAPRLFLRPDRDVLTRERCRLRDAAEYTRVKLVIRQTAAITIAARHDGTPFRNSLLAAFETAEYPHLFTLGLLNSTLYRALHLASRRDARQGAFPQVKVAHLRALPAPAGDAPPPLREGISELALRASERGLSAELRRALDALVFDLFGVGETERGELVGFVAELSPRAGLASSSD